MSFPAFSITAGACALDCEHCHAKILEPMLPATRPPNSTSRSAAWSPSRICRASALRWFESPQRDPLRTLLPGTRTPQAGFPALRIAIHSPCWTRRARARWRPPGSIPRCSTSSVTRRRSRGLPSRPPRGRLRSELGGAVCDDMEIVPHIVIGLHFGQVRGEARALDIVARHAVQAWCWSGDALLRGSRAFHATRAGGGGRDLPRRPAALPAREVLRLRTPGRPAQACDRRLCRAAGLDGIAFPADGVVALATGIGRPSPSSTPAVPWRRSRRRVSRAWPERTGPDAAGGRHRDRPRPRRRTCRARRAAGGARVVAFERAPGGPARAVRGARAGSGRRRGRGLGAYARAGGPGHVDHHRGAGPM